MVLVFILNHCNDFDYLLELLKDLQGAWNWKNQSWAKCYKAELLSVLGGGPSRSVSWGARFQCVLRLNVRHIYIYMYITCWVVSARVSGSRITGCLYRVVLGGWLVWADGRWTFWACCHSPCPGETGKGGRQQLEGSDHQNDLFGPRCFRGWCCRLVWLSEDLGFPACTITANFVWSPAPELLLEQPKTGTLVCS